MRPIPGEEAGRGDEYRPEGFHWLWVPVRFDDRFLMVIAQEDADGYRTLNEAVLVRDGHPDAQLGWPQTDITYRPGTRHPERAVIHLTDPSRKPLELGVEILASSPLAVGAGYPPADGWQHGTWQGRGWTRPPGLRPLATRPPTPWPRTASPTTPPASPSTAGPVTASSSTAASAATTPAASRTTPPVAP